MLLLLVLVAFSLLLLYALTTGVGKVITIMAGTTMVDGVADVVMVSPVYISTICFSGQ